MKLLSPPWKTAWYDDQISDRFFQEMSRTESGATKGMDNSAQWMNQLVIELGQLDQHMTQLESDQANASQVRLAFERSLKLATMAAHLAAALDRADPANHHTPVAPTAIMNHLLPREMPRPIARSGLAAAAEHAQEAPAASEETQFSVVPLRQTVTGLSRRGLSVAEIEVITGQSRTQIESVLNER
ncbi:MAG: hypothetical protein O7A69_13810 [SAR324 cluster bacterium]|nr:hypothetical protein [SAR324 cluster bacterium]